MDKIEEILKDSFNVEVPDEYMGIVAREIRQQIGRELVECSLHMAEGDIIKFTECVNKVLLLGKE